MKQLVFIHGGETFDTYDAYLEALKDWTYEPFKEFGERWKATLGDKLGEEWEVFTPTMPSKYNAKYIEWSIWFEKVLPYLNDGVSFVGHSLGGIFLAKYLSEHTLPVSVHTVWLIAAPFDADDSEYSLADFVLPESLELFSKQVQHIFVYHSEDDPIVPFSALQKYTDKLPGAIARVFSDRGHFLQPEFPELIESIKETPPS
ncbi:alpha/beta hydrolase [Patescibacteria group bacterium]|nr:alpha/beta hydrolase [Patescibacteria group bacterium]MBU1500992.1 alpha/beta hydrolase [Patescibacteria group bacterium]MBU2080622.1 alpha/beta hydrolase [Patescibacteria group bacterium]MBU2124303.1 alpha/beta hydrolase [Patescibacteria group bacterium]MBU2194429.1 alpha/beta hydrolase [Patescibacteria group bacterium]